MPATPQNEGWLYRVLWEAQARPVDKCAQNLSNPVEICEALRPEIARSLAESSLPDYERAISELDGICIAHVLRAFSDMGWTFEPRKRFSVMETASGMGIIGEYRRLFEHLLEMLVEEGILGRDDGFWEVIASPEDIASKKRLETPLRPGAEAEASLLARCGPRLAEVMQGKCSPLPLLFPDADLSALTKFYRESPPLRIMSELTGKVLLFALERMPADRCFRILEIGAGTGSVASRLLPLLRGRNVEYLFTDVAHIFLNSARIEFKDYPFVQYRILDIEKEPQSEGIEPRRHDMVIAANVLHAIGDLRRAIYHTRQMLAPGGMLVLIEESGPLRWVDLTYWGGWSEAGILARTPAAEEWLKETGIISMSPRQGLEILDFLLSGNHVQTAVAIADWAKFRKRYRLKNAPFFSRLVARENAN